MKIEVPSPQFAIQDCVTLPWKSVSMPFLEEQDYWTKFDSEKDNREWVATVKSKSQPVGTWREGVVYLVHVGKVLYYYLLDTSGLATYVVRCRLESVAGLKLPAVCQTSLWRDRESAQSVSVAAWVFFKQLLPTYGSILSDATQSRDGKAFWIRRCAEALDLWYHVYALKTDENKVSIVSKAKLHDLSWTKKLWSTTDQSFQHRRLLITKSLLKPSTVKKVL